MNSILIIVPYFGKFNNYFDLFLKSIEYNETIDFLIITDDRRKFNYPKNCKVVYSTFKKEAKKITSYFDFEAKCENTYKLCDYRPFLGEIYKEYSKNYDFWGWCDIDIIFGNIRKFATNDLLTYCDKLYIHGHFSLIKNNGYVNNLLLNSPIYDDVWHCKEAFLIADHICFYDEFNGSVPTLYRLGAKIYSNICDIANIDYSYFPFYLCQWDHYTLFKNQKLIFQFKHGQLLGISEAMKQKEFLYIHLQKRELENNVSNSDSFMILPNKFLDLDDNFDYKKEWENELINEKLYNNYEQHINDKYKNQKFSYFQPKQEVLKMLKKN